MEYYKIKKDKVNYDPEIEINNFIKYVKEKHDLVLNTMQERVIRNFFTYKDKFSHHITGRQYGISFLTELLCDYLTNELNKKVLFITHRKYKNDFKLNLEIEKTDMNSYYEYYDYIICDNFCFFNDNVFSLEQRVIKSEFFFAFSTVEDQVSINSYEGLKTYFYDGGSKRYN